MEATWTQSSTDVNMTEGVTHGSLEATLNIGHPYSRGVTVFLAALILIVSVLILAGNTLVIIAFCTEKKLRSFGNYFILNLAITDLMVGFLIPIYAPYPLLGQWPLGKTACVVFVVVDYVVPLASSWNMALISMERFWSIAWPVHYRIHQSPRLASIIMTLPWIAGILVYGPVEVFWEQWTGQDPVPEGECYVAYYSYIPYLLFGSAMEFYLPFTTVAIFNFLIYHNIRCRNKTLMIRQGTAPTAGTAQKEESASAQAALARDKKSARSLAILVTTYGVTWGPYEVCALANPLCKFCVPGLLFEVTFWILWLNSMVNPMLYPYLQVKFRLAFRRLLCNICGKGEPQVYPVSESNTRQTVD